MSAESEQNSLCHDFMRFQEWLKKGRSGDDTIINVLNSSIPTIQSLRKSVDLSSRCKEIQADLETSRESRNAQIRQCIEYQAKNVERLRELKIKSNPDDNLKETRQLSHAQRQLRILQNELNVEEVIQERTQKALYERCREYV